MPLSQNAKNLSHLFGSCFQKYPGSGNIDRSALAFGEHGEEVELILFAEKKGRSGGLLVPVPCKLEIFVAAFALEEARAQPSLGASGAVSGGPEEPFESELVVLGGAEQTKASEKVQL